MARRSADRVQLPGKLADGACWLTVGAGVGRGVAVAAGGVDGVEADATDDGADGDTDGAGLTDTVHPATATTTAHRNAPAPPIRTITCAPLCSIDAEALGDGRGDTVARQ